jgi:hypothetical protein
MFDIQKRMFNYDRNQSKFKWRLQRMHTHLYSKIVPAKRKMLLEQGEDTDMHRDYQREYEEKKKQDLRIEPEDLRH